MYTVEKIFGKRSNPKTGKSQYHVKWLGYSYEESTWQPQNHLIYVKHLIDEYNRQLKEDKSIKHELKTKQINLSKSDDVKTKNQNNLRKLHRLKNLKQQQSDQQVEESESMLQQIDQCPKKDEKSNQEIQNSQSHSKNKVRNNIRKIYKVDKIKEIGGNNLQYDNSPLDLHEMPQRNINHNRSDFKIKGICRRGKSLLFYVQIGKEMKWMRRQQVIQQHAIELCEFYERNLSFV